MRSLLFGVLLLSLAAGCAARNTKVSGQVRYKGQPLPGGTVTFQPADTKFNTVTVLLDEQGNYEATLPVGEVRVAVDNRDLEPRPAPPPQVKLPPTVQEAIKKAKSKETPPASAEDKNPTASVQHRGKYVQIPERYYTVEKSGLTFTVGLGNPKLDIELK
jgi:hypothetical protein